LTTNLFVPGWGATAALYARGLPADWEPLDPPTFRATRGELCAYRRWLEAEIARRRTLVSVAGHSMGGALAVLAAADRPEQIAELILLSPSGLPVTKPIRASFAAFVGQVVRGSYPARELCRASSAAVAAPMSALRLARAVQALDLTNELEQIRTHGIRCSVIGCSTDELITPAHCRRLAELLGAGYREVCATGGHIWMITHPELLMAELATRQAVAERSPPKE